MQKNVQKAKDDKVKAAYKQKAQLEKVKSKAKDIKAKS